MRIVRKPLSILIMVIFAIMTLTVSSGCELLPFTTVSKTTSTLTVSSTPIKPGFTISIPSNSQPSNLPSVADVVATVKPSVVAINVEVNTTDIFGRTYTEEGAGSGWIIDKSGIIVTNNHVVEGATKVTVVLDDGRSFEANLNDIATDSLADLAVIKISASDLTAAKVGDSSSLRVGDWVVAIGNSLGQGIRATVGIVSQQSVSLEVSSGQTLSGLIETDAAINPGNSGGPLVNMAGEVVGINSAKIAEVGVEGVGYAIGTGEASPIIQQLVNTGYVIRPYLGASLESINFTYIRRYDLSVMEGALVISVVAGGPAATAGLQAGDVISGFAGQTITSLGELRQAIDQNEIGQTVEITYWRGRSQSKTTATLIATPPS
jgi:serine protease Do